MCSSGTFSPTTSVTSLSGLSAGAAAAAVSSGAGLSSPETAGVCTMSVSEAAAVCAASAAPVPKAVPQPESSRITANARASPARSRYGFFMICSNLSFRFRFPASEHPESRRKGSFFTITRFHGKWLHSREFFSANLCQREIQRADSLPEPFDVRAYCETL